MSANYSTYYYKAGPNTQYPDRITRVKDGMIDLLNGNTSKGILPVSDDKLIGLTTFSVQHNLILLVSRLLQTI